MRRLRIVCAVTVLALVGFAVALKYTATSFAQTQSDAALSDPSSHVAARLQSLPLQLPSMVARGSATQAFTSTMQEPAAQSQSGEMQGGATQATAPQTGANAPVTIATNISARALAVEPQSPSASNAASAENSAVPESALAYLTNADKGNRIFTLATVLNPSSASTAPSGALSASSKIALFAGQAAAGSLGDGGTASGAEFDLKLDSRTMRSGVAVAPDGTIFVADTLNGTIRSIAGAASSEPGIVRSVVGRFGPRQNFELAEPLGLALDRAGNLYIADRGANAVLMLHAATSDSPGVLEILAHLVSPASVGVTLDGAKVFAASPDTGAIVEINTKTRSISTSGISPSQLFAESQKRTGARIIPTGLAVDGAANLFVSLSGPGGGLDQIWRLDAVSGNVKSVAHGLSSPGEIAFDSNGNLFVADQDTRRLLELRGAGAPANGVTLTPPPNQTPYGPEPVNGTSPTQAFTLTNSSGGIITQISSAFQGANPGDFTVLNTSCTGTLLTDTSCAFNVAFTPLTTGARSASLAVTYTAAGAQNTLIAPVTGTGDDYQITPANAVGPIYQITIAQGLAATFLLQIVPDDTFSGPVTLVCPAGSAVPAATTCGISAGTTVTTPLVPMLTVNVSPGTPVPFNVTFQTTNGVVTKPAAIGFSPIIRTQSGDSNGPGSSAHNFTQFPAMAPLGALAILCAMLTFSIFRRNAAQPDATLDILAKLSGSAISGARLQRLISFVALFVVFAVALVGCHHSSSTTGIVITPKGTSNLTVQGTAQNATRGFTVTLVVD